MSDEDRSSTEPPGAAIVLAAGASSRFEGAVKATVPVDGEPAVRRVARIAREAGFAPVVVVTGAHRKVVVAALGSREGEIVDNPDWERGRTGSIQAGLAAVGDPSAVLLWPVDHPFAGPMTVDALRDRAKSDAMAVWFVPTFEGRGGHPVLLTSPTFDAIRSLSVEAPLRSLLPRFGPQVVRVPVRDAGVVANIDTRAAYDAVETERSEGRWTGD
ncbi:MAG: nucleotidyltransferase family protein [Thermoplasmata archaeon]|nr:nucleotidyltransferase family protein [Thermoplasmata archaeon]